MKPLIYPFTYEQWLNHPKTKPKLNWIKNVCDEMRNNKKYGKQLEMKL